MASMSGYTFGVYLRPDPGTCELVARITDLLRRQFGIVSAAAFPPHATLAGAIPISVPTINVVDRLDHVLKSAHELKIFNAGVSRIGDYVVFDIDRTEDGAKNHDLQELARLVNQSLDIFDDGGTGFQIERFSLETFHAHLTLASHDLRLRPDLVDEVHEFIEELRPAFKESYVSHTVDLFKFHSPDWGSAWWKDLKWWHIRSWRLGPAQSIDASFAPNACSLHDVNFGSASRIGGSRD